MKKGLIHDFITLKVGLQLYLRHHGGVDHATLGADGVHLLPDAADDGEVLREVGRQNSRYSVGVQILQLGHFWTK